LNNPASPTWGTSLTGSCRVDRPDYRPADLMKKLLTKSFLILTLLTALLGCASPGPSPEQQTRDADQQREAERQQKEFRKSLPPVTNPGQGW
jgi:predicted small lipoprotein YifL